MFWAKLASLLMMMAVGIGAFGAHALREKLSGYHLDIFKTAVQYHFVHALGLFVVSWLTTQFNDPRLSWAGFLLVAGIILFSGSLYVLAVTGIKGFGAITPLGGLAFLGAWGLIFLILNSQ